MSFPNPLLGRTLVFVAHPDDEAIGCGALLQRMEDPVVIFATDGAPRSDFFWTRYGSRESYAQLRAREAEKALRTIGLQHFHFLCESRPIVDQELYTELDRAYADFREILEAEMPDAILTMAYEGGHPDHDCCCFVAAMAGKEFDLPVWEMPLYHRHSATFQPQQFLDCADGYRLDITQNERELKLKMWRAYESQADVLRDFVPDREHFRPLHAYDFSRPPHPGPLNYEAWQWPMSGADLSNAFSSLVLSSPNRNLDWGTAA